MPRKPAFISHSPKREAEIQGRMLDVLEARFRRQFEAAIIAESDDLLRGYRDLGYPPPVSDDAVARFRDVYRSLALASARTFGQRIVTRGKAAGYDLETKAIDFGALFSNLANLWINLEPIRRRIQSVSDTTRMQIVLRITKGQADGLGVEGIAKLIADNLPRIARQRARVIARTETHGASNFAAHETARSTGLDLEKEWVSVEDHRTRAIWKDDAFDHASMNGQKRDMDDPFDMPWVGGAGEPLKIQFPGQAGLPGGAVINCRCVVVHGVKGFDDFDD